MINQSQHTTRLPRVKHSSPLPAPLYGAALVTLAIFFSGLLLFRAPINGYLVTSEVTYTTPLSSRTKSAAARSTATWSPELDLQQIANAFRAAEQQVDTVHSGNVAKKPMSEDALRKIHRQVSVETDGQQKGIIVNFRGERREWSIVFVDQLVRQLVLANTPTRRRAMSTGAMSTGAMSTGATPASTCESTPASIRAAKWLVEQSRHYERKARLDMEEALSRFFEQADNASHVATAKPGAAKPSRQRNPDWEQLQDELAKKKDRLVELFKTVTPSHPQARFVAIEIDQMQQELASTPEYLQATAARRAVPMEEPSTQSVGDGRWNARRVAFASSKQPASERLVPPQSTSGPSAGEPDGSEPDGELLAGRANYRQLHDGYEAAVQQREDAERRLAELATTHHSVRREAGPPPCVIRPAQVVGQFGGRPSGRLVLAIGILGILCGAAVFWRNRSLQGLRQINSVEQIQEVLSLPLVGRIGLDPITASVTRRAAWGWLIRWGVRASELVLAMMIVTFLWSVLRDPPVSHELADNLLGALVERVATSIGI